MVNNFFRFLLLLLFFFYFDWLGLYFNLIAGDFNAVINDMDSSTECWFGWSSVGGGFTLNFNIPKREGFLFFRTFTLWFFDVTRKSFFVFPILSNSFQLVFEYVNLPLVALVVQFQVSIKLVGGDCLRLHLSHLAFVLLNHDIAMLSPALDLQSPQCFTAS